MLIWMKNNFRISCCLNIFSSPFPSLCRLLHGGPLQKPPTCLHAPPFQAARVCWPVLVFPKPRPDCVRPSVAFHRSSMKTRDSSVLWSAAHWPAGPRAARALPAAPPTQGRGPWPGPSVLRTLSAAGVCTCCPSAVFPSGTLIIQAQPKLPGGSLPGWLITPGVHSLLFSRSVVSDSCDPMDCSPPGSSVHGILQARILGRVAISFSRGSSWPRDHTCVSCLTGGFFTRKPIHSLLRMC